MIEFISPPLIAPDGSIIGVIAEDEKIQAEGVRRLGPLEGGAVFGHVVPRIWVN